MKHNWKKMDHAFKFYQVLDTLNSEHNWEDLCIQSRNQRLTCTYDNHIQIRGGPIFRGIWWYFIVDLLVQHKFCCINLSGRSSRTWKTTWRTPTYPICYIWWFLSKFEYFKLEYQSKKHANLRQNSTSSSKLTCECPNFSTLAHQSFAKASAHAQATYVWLGVRYAGIIWLHLYLIDVCSGEGQNKHHKDTYWKEIKLRLQIL